MINNKIENHGNDISTLGVIYCGITFNLQGLMKDCKLEKNSSPLWAMVLAFSKRKSSGKANSNKRKSSFYSRVHLTGKLKRT